MTNTRTILRTIADDLRRFSPIWGGGVLASFFFTAFFFSAAQNATLDADPSVAFARMETALDHSVVNYGILLVCAYACLACMALFSYLYDHRSVFAIHAMPVTRKVLFCSHLCSGVVLFLIPLVTTALGHCLVVARFGASLYGKIGLYSVALLLGYFCFFGIACVCCMLTGQLFAVPIVYAALNALPYALYYCYRGLCSSFFYGVYLNFQSSADLTYWSNLTPVLGMVRAVKSLYGGLLSEWNLSTPAVILLTPLSATAFLALFLRYAVFGLACMSIAYALYRVRKLERTGTFLLFPLLPFGFSLCACFFSICAVFLKADFQCTDLPNLLLLAGACIIGVIIFIACEMLLQKTFRIFSAKTMRKGLVICLCLTLCFSYFVVDWSGYEEAIPNSEDIACVYIQPSTLYYGQLTPYSNILSTTDPTAIAKLRNIHAAFITQYHRQVTAERGALATLSFGASNAEYSAYRYLTAEGNTIAPTAENQNDLHRQCIWFTIQYVLHDGRIVMRQYRALAHTELIALEDSPQHLLESYLQSLPSGIDALKTLRTSLSPSVHLSGSNSAVSYSANTRDALNIVDALCSDLQAQNAQWSLLPLADTASSSEWEGLTISFTCLPLVGDAAADPATQAAYTMLQGFSLHTELEAAFPATFATAEYATNGRATSRRAT